MDANPKATVGWQAQCACDAKAFDANRPYPAAEPAVVLDPFAGSGTTGMVANRLSRRAILIDLNGDYLKQQLKRNAQTPLGLAG
jgi:16S rRNA G966 N2-methylase RsmD